MFSETAAAKLTAEISAQLSAGPERCQSPLSPHVAEIVELQGVSSVSVVGRRFAPVS